MSHESFLFVFHHTRGLCFGTALGTLFRLDWMLKWTGCVPRIFNLSSVVWHEKSPRVVPHPTRPFIINYVPMAVPPVLGVPHDDDEPCHYFSINFHIRRVLFCWASSELLAISILSPSFFFISTYFACVPRYQYGYEYTERPIYLEQIVTRDSHAIKQFILTWHVSLSSFSSKSVKPSPPWRLIPRLQKIRGLTCKGKKTRASSLPQRKSPQVISSVNINCLIN